MEKKESKSAIIIDNNLSKDILEQLPTPVMAVNPEFKILYLNQAGCRLLNKDWSEIDGRYCYDIFSSKHCRTDECRMKNVLEGGQPCTVRNEVSLNGRTIPIEYTADVLRNAEGEIFGGLEYIIDITETVRQEQKLKE